MSRLLRPALLLALPALAFAQGALNPPADAFLGGAPKASMKTLDQIEARTPLQAGAPGVTQNANGGFTIGAAGSYYLTGNLTIRAGDGITITTDNVTLDLAGFTILSTSTPYAGSAIYLANTPQINVTIRNGQVASNITLDNSGTASGTGFANGIKSAGQTYNCSAFDVNINGAGSCGISFSDGSLIARCTAQNCGTVGLRANAVSNSSVFRCTMGIAGSTLSDCHAERTKGTAISANGSASNCFGLSLNGNGVSALIATNCWGEANNAEGLKARTATQCVGSSNSGKGMVVADAATNCSGHSSTGTGLTANSATGCTGDSDSGTGLFANVALNCKGTSRAGTGLDTNSAANDYTGTATGCTGISDTGHGLIAAVATNCTGRTTDKSKIAVWVSGTATGCRGTNTGATGTGAQSAISCDIAVACTATTGTINAASKQLGTP